MFEIYETTEECLNLANLDVERCPAHFSRALSSALNSRLQPVPFASREQGLAPPVAGAGAGSAAPRAKTRST